MKKIEIFNLLYEQDYTRLEHLLHQADAICQQIVGGAVHLRGLIEISDYCVRQCKYCGLRSNRNTLLNNMIRHY